MDNFILNRLERRTEPHLGSRFNRKESNEPLFIYFPNPGRHIRCAAERPDRILHFLPKNAIEVAVSG
jgi:hypothetical protein